MTSIKPYNFNKQKKTNSMIYLSCLLHLLHFLNSLPNSSKKPPVNSPRAPDFLSPVLIIFILLQY